MIKSFFNKIFKIFVVIILLIFAFNKFIRPSSNLFGGENFLSSLTSGSQIAKNPAPSKPIIDLSGWQLPGQIDYDLLSQQISGAIVRVQHGGDNQLVNAAAYTNGEDKSYQTHIVELQRRNVPVAVYAYVSGTSLEDMRQEARDFYERASAFSPSFWWLDVEEETMDDMNAGIEAFRSELASLGVSNIGIYSQDWFLENLDIEVDNFKALWFAHYGADTGQVDSKPDTLRDYALHQYTSKGRLLGFSNDLDLNQASSMEDYQQIFSSK
ncbi:glycoside hydrolase family 25 protein [Streptococcaceae bacterium ESL0687]|nr:glycoside hydrolase family 25 protein [Streptococcaceae bacterium ESL0687]